MKHEQTLFKLSNIHKSPTTICFREIVIHGHFIFNLVQCKDISVYCYDLTGDYKKCKTLPSLSTIQTDSDYHCNTICDRDYILLTGGSINEINQNKVSCFDISRQEWVN